MVGLLHAGTGRRGDVDISYATPMYWLWPRIKERYKDADFDFVIPSLGRYGKVRPFDTSDRFAAT